MQHLKSACFVLGIFVLTACSSSPERGGVPMRRFHMPEWAVTGEHPDFPADRFLVTYGMSHTRAGALRLAEERLEAEVTAWPLREHAQTLKNTQFAQLVPGPAAWIQLDEFGESVRREAAGSGFDNVVVCAISRDNVRLHAARLLTTARNELAASPEPPGAGTVQTRIELLGAYFMKAARVLALQLIINGELERGAFAKAEDAAQRLTELPSLMRATQMGSGGIARFSGGVDGELVLFARFRGEPPAGVPLRWRLASNLRGAVQGDAAFNPVGEARCTVMSVIPNGDDTGQVMASLDVDQVLKRRTGIRMPAWFWTIVLPSLNNGEVAIDVNETVQGAAKGIKPLFQPEFRNWAKARKLRIVDGPPIDQRPFALKISGSLDLRSSTTGEFATAYVTGQIDLTDMNTGQALYSYTPGIHRTGDAGISEASVALTTQKEAAVEALLEFATRLAALLPAPEDAQAQ